MTGKTFFNNVTGSHEDILALVLALLDGTGCAYCVIGGLAVNAYAEPVVSLDLELVVIMDRIDTVRAAALAHGLSVRDFEHSLNLSTPASDLRIQVQTDPGYQEFIGRAELRSVLGYQMMVACVKGVLRGKLWAHGDETRRASKRQKDLADIIRLVEAHPELKDAIPFDIARLI